MSKASELDQKLRDCLERITPSNGFGTEFRKVFEEDDPIPDKQAMPYLVARVDTDRRTSNAITQATRVRTYQIEAVFSHRTPRAELNAAGVDVLRAMGIGRFDAEHRVPGLIEDEDQMVFVNPAGKGITTRSLFITVGVTYVEDYN
ncbi:hypothetical protein ACPA5B_11635 [Pseudomonas solani]|uniref:hypothetical protein n=1 Tax=Pseudomonas solani TaxID=2731552 RepID=UPI003C2C4E8D